VTARKFPILEPGPPDLWVLIDVFCERKCRGLLCPFRSGIQCVAAVLQPTVLLLDSFSVPDLWVK
jgi:hypothetical protein